MRRFLIAAALAAALLVPAAAAPTETLACSQYVLGYTRSNGTYVSGHYRSCANGTTSDNWSTRGNQNPYTGAWGTRDPYGLLVAVLPVVPLPLVELAVRRQAHSASGSLSASRVGLSVSSSARSTAAPQR